MLAARGVSVSYGALTVLHHVDLVVAAGDRIAVVGPNGVGKSTLLRVLAGETVPDIGVVTASGTVGYLPQERDLGRVGAAPDRGGTPGSGGPAEDGEPAMRYLARRTGVLAAEHRMQDASEALAAGSAAGSSAVGSEYADALDRYLALGGPDLETRAAELAAELGLPADLDRPVTGLSGGQAARLALAAVLLARFDALLLDEPTNDLDLAGLELLEQHLTGYRGAVVLVSHDRAFLERVATDVVRIDSDSRTAARYGGGYQAYQVEIERDKARAAEEYEVYAAKRDDLVERARRQKEWARSGERAATSTAARRREPDKNVLHARAQGAQQAGARASAALRAVDRLDPVAEPRKEWQLRLRFGVATRSGEVVAVLSGAVVERGGFRLGPVSMQLGWGDRVLITGANGSGKTTLLQAILGRIPLTSGRGSLGASVRIGEIGQARQTFDPAAPLLDAFRAEAGQSPADARTLLAKFGLGAEHVLRPVSSLSPGERTRADLALLMQAGANLLVLDEPTNHLDLPAIEQLELALGSYDGTLLLVTHDRRLAEQVAITRKLAVTGGVVTES